MLRERLGAPGIVVNNAGPFNDAPFSALREADWDYVMNANDSYWTPNASVRLEGFARIIGCEQCERTMRTQMVTKYVEDHFDGNKELFYQLADDDGRDPHRYPDFDSIKAQLGTHPAHRQR